MTDDESLTALQSGEPSARIADDYDDGPRSLAERSGEHRLVLAILADAIAVYVKSPSGGAVRKHEARGARAWLESRDRSSPFAFEWICDVLGLDSSRLRRGLRALRVRPEEVAARLALRHHGRMRGLAAQPRALRAAARRGPVAERARDTPRAG